MEEAKVLHLIEHGNTILASVEPRGEAEGYMDKKLSEVEQRWYNLVTQVCVCVSIYLSVVIYTVFSLSLSPPVSLP